MRFQGLAVILGKKRWPELIAHQRKKDLGLDAYAAPGLTPERVGKGLAASITPTLRKLSDDVKKAKKNFPDLQTLLFVTARKVGNANRKRWEEDIQRQHGLELHIIEREEVIAQMMLPENASLRASFLHLDIASEPQVANIINRARRASDAVTRTWARRTRGRPLIDLTAVRLDQNGAESADLYTLEKIEQALLHGGRIVLEGPAGRGKTTMLIQLAKRVRTAGILFMIDLPGWSSSRYGILQYIAQMPAFQAEGLTAAQLARAQHTEPFLMLLNGWNEITESNSMRADSALRELERDFPSAGIIVATRAHHVTPPLPGALRLRLPLLSLSQRNAYLAARLGARGVELRQRIDAHPSLDELTLTPFILSEVASLFEAATELPPTKLGVLHQVVRLQERREEHRNALYSVPIFGRQEDYLKALATEMTRRGAVTLPESDARAIVAAVARNLAISGQIEPTGPPQILATLTARHVLERDTYPHTTFRFEHQQFQEYYAALDIRERLVDPGDDDQDVTERFTPDYVNDPAWAEPLRMTAATFAEHTADRRYARSGVKLVEMALAVDLVFAGEMARLCGSSVWGEVRAVVGERFRAVYAIPGSSFRRYALAAMLATGADDFNDLIVPLLADEDQQTRLRTYRLWPDIRASSLGSNWRELVRGWSDEVRADFVSELLHHRIDDEVAAFAVDDGSMAVKKAAATGLMWSRSDDALTRVLKSMDERTFDDVALKSANLMPPALRSKTVAAMRRFVEISPDDAARLRAALDLVKLGEPDLDMLKNAMARLPCGDTRNLSPYNIQPALEHLRDADPAWASEWVAVHISEGLLGDYEYWLPFAPAIPDDLVEKTWHASRPRRLRTSRAAKA